MRRRLPAGQRRGRARSGGSADPPVGFTPPALQAGVRAVFGFPLRFGTVRLGALNFYRDRPGPMSDDQHADALVIADVTARLVLETQAGAPPGAVAEELEAGADFHFAVRDTAGIVSVQLEISVTEALIRLRAHAFSHDRPIADVAQDVIAHQAPARMNPRPPAARTGRYYDGCRSPDPGPAPGLC